MSKLKKGTEVVICPNCKRENTINDCEIHKNSKEACYYCHLVKEHVSKYKEDKPDDNPVDKTATKPPTKKDMDKAKKTKDDDKGLYI